MAQLMDRNKLDRINGYPSTISEVNHAQHIYPEVREKYRKIEKELLQEGDDEDEKEKLIKN